MRKQNKTEKIEQFKIKHGERNLRGIEQKISEIKEVAIEVAIEAIIEDSLTAWVYADKHGWFPLEDVLAKQVERFNPDEEITFEIPNRQAFEEYKSYIFYCAERPTSKPAK